MFDFAHLGGFENLINYLSPSENTQLDLNLISFIFYILDKCAFLFHKDYVKKLALDIQERIFKFLNEMSHDQLRNIRKDTLESINKVLKFFLGKNSSEEEVKKVLDEFSLNFSLRMIKTEFFDKRKQAVSYLTDIIQSNKNNTSQRSDLIRILEENQIFSTIFGKNAHHQIISMSKEILQLLLQENKVSDKDFETILANVKSGGNLEEKLTILRLLNEVSSSLSKNQVSHILNYIYSSKLHIQDMHKEEIDLIYSLSTHKSQEKETLDKCIIFFIGCIQSSKESDNEKINQTINKVYDITTNHTDFKQTVLNLCLESLEKVNVYYLTDV